MMTKSAFSVVGLAHKFCLAAEAEGWTPEMLNALAENSSLLAGMRSVQLGIAKIKPILHAIDCDADPFVPAGWSYHEEDQLPSRVRGIFTWDPAKVKLYLSKKQRGNKRIVGNDLRKELAKKPTMNASILDYLLKPENQHLIPEDWKKDERGNTRYIFFWGTVYRLFDDRLFVRFLCWGDGAWRWLYFWLGDGFDSGAPALLRVIPSGDLA